MFESEKKLGFLIRRSIKFTKHLGFPRGLLILAASMLGKANVAVNLRDIRYPLRIRPRTSDRFVFEQIFLDQDYYLPPDFAPHFIIDAGANVGYASIYFASRYPEASILAIEPDSTNFQRLVENTSAYPNIATLKAALWSNSDPLIVTNECESWACQVEAANKADKQTVPGITVENLLKLYGQPSIDILKMDIEGAEREVFKSNYDSWLPFTQVLMVEIHDHLRPGSSSAVFDAASPDQFRKSTRGEYTLFVNRSLRQDFATRV